jgi:hypothetical protein
MAEESKRNLKLRGKLNDLGMEFFGDIEHGECFYELEMLEGFLKKVDEMKRAALDYYHSNKEEADATGRIIFRYFEVRFSDGKRTSFSVDAFEMESNMFGPQWYLQHKIKSFGVEPWDAKLYEAIGFGEGKPPVFTEYPLLVEQQDD